MNKQDNMINMADFSISFCHELINQGLWWVNFMSMDESLILRVCSFSCTFYVYLLVTQRPSVFHLAIV